MVSGPRLETPAGLLARWGIPADAELTRAERVAVLEASQT
jgi:hypothetical protein